MLRIAIPSMCESASMNMISNVILGVDVVLLRDFMVV